MRKRRWVLALVALAVVSTLIAAYAVWHEFQLMKEIFRYKCVECDPNVLLPQIEEVFGCRFPVQMCQVRAARTYGVWDSDKSFCFVRFTSDANGIDTFLASLRDVDELGPYGRQEDSRQGLTKGGAPAWFAEPIELGKTAYFNLGEIFIDTAMAERQKVYIYGFGPLPLPETPVADTNATPGSILNHD